MHQLSAYLFFLHFQLNYTLQYSLIKTSLCPGSPLCVTACVLHFHMLKRSWYSLNFCYLNKTDIDILSSGLVTGNILTQRRFCNISEIVTFFHEFWWAGTTDEIFFLRGSVPGVLVFLGFIVEAVVELCDLLCSWWMLSPIPVLLITGCYPWFSMSAKL